MQLMSHIFLFLATAICLSLVNARNLRRGLQPSTFNASGIGYIQVVLLQNDLSSRGKDVLDTFVKASERWSSIIVSELPTINFQTSVDLGDVTNCGVDFTFVAGDVVENLVIFASVAEIDGRGGTLGFARPCNFIMINGDTFTRLGVMTFDTDDVEFLLNQGTFEATVLHEMGHVLGLGSFWPSLGLVNGQFAYQGMNGNEGYNLIGGIGDAPVENNGGSGTMGAHWEQDVFQNELMTGFLSGDIQPLSILTVRALQDLGFEVNASAADPYRIPGVDTPTSVPTTAMIWMGNDTMAITPDGMEMQPDGSVRPLGNNSPEHSPSALLLSVLLLSWTIRL